tara:strand:- start:24 stop:206 length:183 start_codon:yes stop_codon:yes gene_type:complete
MKLPSMTGTLTIANPAGMTLRQSSSYEKQKDSDINDAETAMESLLSGQVRMETKYRQKHG